jgi:hypothetical protein
MARVLEATDKVADHSTHMTQTMASVTDSETALAKFISLQLEKVHQLRLKRPHIVSEKHRVKVNYGLKTDQGVWCVERIYAGALWISGNLCLLKATGNPLSRQLALTGQTISGRKLDKIIISIPTKEWDIHTLLHSKLYLSLGASQTLQLTYSPAHGHTFLQFLCRAKWGELLPIRAEMRTEGVVLFIPQFGEVVYRGAVDLSQVLFSPVQRLITKNLQRAAKTHKYLWTESLIDRFKSPHKLDIKPRLIDLFLSQRIIEIPVRDQHAPYLLNGQQIDLSLSQRGHKEVLVLSSQQHTVTVKEEDWEYRFLVGLQFRRIRESWKSALSSLELKRLVQSLMQAGRL